MGKQKTDVPRAARQILEQSRKKLLHAAPELLPAIYLMQAEPTETPGPLSSDGLKLYYHPETVIRSYLEDRSALCRALLHVLCHGLLGHFEKRRGQIAPIFDAAADVAAQALAMRIDGDYGLLRSWGEETVELLCAPNAGVDAL